MKATHCERPTSSKLATPIAKAIAVPAIKPINTERLLKKPLANLYTKTTIKNVRNPSPMFV